MAIDAVQHPTDQAGRGATCDPEEGAHLEAEELGDRGSALGATVGELFRRFAERILVDRVEGEAQFVDGPELSDLSRKLGLMERRQLVEQRPCDRGVAGRRLEFGGDGVGIAHVFDYTP